jgi:hypothetical protein
VNNSERVYALYVQANPVPDPDLLPLTPAEAELLIIERSPVMDTQDRIHVQPAPPVPRRRRLVFGLAAVLVVGAAAAAIVLFVGGGGDKPVAAADAAPHIVFDGTSCRYDGPTLIETGTVEVTLVNTSTEEIQAAGFFMLESRLAAELERTPLGTDMALNPDDPMPAGTPSVVAASAGSEVVGLWPMPAGTYIIDCVTSTGGPTNHVWRAATLVEAVAP